MTIIAIMVLGLVEPLLTRFENKLEIHNNVDLLVMTYSLFTFTDFVSDPGASYLMGYFLIFMTFKHIMVNIFNMAWTSILQIKAYCRMKAARRKAIKDLNALMKMRQHKAL